MAKYYLLTPEPPSTPRPVEQWPMAPPPSAAVVRPRAPSRLVPSHSYRTPATPDHSPLVLHIPALTEPSRLLRVSHAYTPLSHFDALFLFYAHTPFWDPSVDFLLHPYTPHPDDRPIFSVHKRTDLFFDRVPHTFGARDGVAGSAILVNGALLKLGPALAGMSQGTSLSPSDGSTPRRRVVDN
ncbi:hypothetical protein C8R47DRAFT_1193485 [Mycena vitilis]|nr:hypothetical protein C8R47DRAFT_1193485 [Mycena vitilis]